MTGYQWQRDIEAQHERYQRAGLALAATTSAKVRAGRFVAKGPPDFFVLTRTVAWVLDAKCYRDGFKLGDLPDHQASALDMAEKLGHRAGLLLWVPTGGELAEWRYLRSAWLEWRNNGGRNYIIEGRRFTGTDWLSVA